MSRDLRHLSPAMQSMAMAFITDCQEDYWLQKNGIDLLVTCTYRSKEEQERLYAQGRTTSGPVVTRARGGQSWHNAVDAHGQPAAEAIDVVPLRYGKAIWGTRGDGIDENPDDDATDDLEVWQRIGVLGKAVGLKWYGEPDAPFREMPHFQNPSPTMKRG